MTDEQFRAYNELINFCRELIATKSSTPEEREALEKRLSQILGK